MNPQPNEFAWYKMPNPHDIEAETPQWIEFEYVRQKGSKMQLHQKVKETKLYRALIHEGAGPAVLAAFKELLNPVE